METIENQRPRFGMPRDIAYLNCAYLSPMLDVVREAGTAGMEKKAKPWLVEPNHFFEESDQLRQTFAGLIGATADDVALAPSVSYGIETAVRNLNFEPGRRILVLAEQFPSNVYPWREAAARHDCRLEVVARPADGDWTTPILEALDSDVAVAALPNVHWTDGSLVDLDRIGPRCRELGVPLVLDVTQSLGARPLDVAKVKPAFLTAAGYKWLLGPYSLGFLYVDPAYHNGASLENNWLGREGAENFAGLVDYTDRRIENGRRFDVGERSNFMLVPMALAALKQIEDWGVARIEATLGRFNEKIAARARDMGFRTAPDAFRAAHLLGLRFPDAPPASLAQDLKAAGVFVSMRGDALRISPHLYNDEADVEKLFEVLGRYF